MPMILKQRQEIETARPIIGKGGSAARERIIDHLDLPSIPTKHTALHVVRCRWGEKGKGGWAERRTDRTKKKRVWAGFGLVKG
jgi:hypothetical protein